MRNAFACAFRLPTFANGFRMFESARMLMVCFPDGVCCTCHTLYSGRMPTQRVEFNFIFAVCCRHDRNWHFSIQQQSFPFVSVTHSRIWYARHSRFAHFCAFINISRRSSSPSFFFSFAVHFPHSVVFGVALLLNIFVTTCQKLPERTRNTRPKREKNLLPNLTNR